MFFFFHSSLFYFLYNSERFPKCFDGGIIPCPSVQHSNQFAAGIASGECICNLSGHRGWHVREGWLEEDGLTDYFKDVVLSSKVGIRKPNPEIYLEAARRIGADPAECVYVGDNPIRDIEGAQAAGFGMVIIIREPATLKKYPETGKFVPDRTIYNFNELLDIFPARQG